jgi:hypothetical protein
MYLFIYLFILQVLGSKTKKLMHAHVDMKTI